MDDSSPTTDAYDIVESSNRRASLASLSVRAIERERVVGSLPADESGGDDHSRSGATASSATPPWLDSHL